MSDVCVKDGNFFTCKVQQRKLTLILDYEYFIVKFSKSPKGMKSEKPKEVKAGDDKWDAFANPPRVESTR